MKHRSGERLEEPQNTDLKQLLGKIKTEAKALNSLFWTKDEWEHIEFSLNFFEARMQTMSSSTLENLNWYQNEGWKKFIEGNDTDELG